MKRRLLKIILWLDGSAVRMADLCRNGDQELWEQGLRKEVRLHHRPRSGGIWG